MPKPMLPQLTAGAPLPPISQRGQWEQRPWVDLANLALSLDDAGAVAADVRLDAIPDVWARILGFAMALFDPNHPLHEQTVSAFRGFLAMLALANRHAYRVQTAIVAIAPPGDFLDVMHQLMPDAGFDELTVFFLADNVQQQVIGTTSPLTLVCPNEGIHLNLLAIVPWWGGNRFQDPSESLHPVDRQDLAAWLHHQLLLPLSGLHPRLEYEIKVFRNALLGLPRGAAAHPAAPPLVAGFGGVAGFTQLLAPVAERSDVAIQNLRGGPAARTLLVLDPGLPAAWGLPAAGICFFGGFNYAYALAQVPGVRRNVLGAIMLPANTEWRRPDDFFTDTLVVIQQGGALPGAIQIEGQNGNPNETPLLPVKPELADFLPAVELARRASFHMLGNGIRVSIQLPLAAGRNYEISKTYGADAITRTLVPPVLEVYPDFSHPNWRLYYTFWCNGGDPNAFRAEPLGDWNRAQENIDALQVEVQELSAPPEYFVCSHNGEPIGLIPIALRPLQVQGGLALRAGVDFGTTNSHVALLDPNVAAAMPQSLQLDGPTHHVTSVPAGWLAEYPWRFFLPDRPQAAPFLSLFRRRVPALGAAALAPLRDGHILFWSQAVHRHLGGPTVVARPKWTPGNTAVIEAYLEQLALHTSVQAFRQGAGALEWRWALPSAFTPAVRANFLHLWTRVLDWITRTTGIHTASPGGAPLWTTESVATAIHFTDSGAQPAAGAVFIDMGGGTSDISVWQNQRLLWQTSLILSANELLLEPLFVRRATVIGVLLGGLGLDPAWIASLISARGFLPFAIQFDALLKAYGADILRNLLNPPQPIVDLVGLISLGLGGLFYYTGLIMQSLRRQGTFADTVAGQEAIPTVCLGGNGSALLHWTAGGNWDPSALMNQVFGQFVHPQVRVVERTQHPKEEVARGLVSNSAFAGAVPWGAAVAAVGDAVVAGESFDGRSALDHLTGNDLAAGLNQINICQLEEFVQDYTNQVTCLGLAVPNVPQGLFAAVRQDVIQWAANQRGRPVQDIAVEPLFVVGLKALIRRLT